jgi:hypothetical protein
MIDFGLSKGWLEFVGLVCAALLVAIPFLKCALGSMRKQGGKLPLPTIIVLALCMVQSLIVGGTKTNGVNSLLPQQMMQGGSFLTGFTGLTGLSGAGNLVNLVNPVQQTAWVYTNGTMRVQKNGITWERTIEGVSHQVIE